jgi:hypothetical protein
LAGVGPDVEDSIDATPQKFLSERAEANEIDADSAEERLAGVHEMVGKCHRVSGETMSI